MTELRRLGRTDIMISPVGLGCWQFSEGKGLAGGFWEALPEQETNAIVEASLAGGVSWFDTAEVYGGGRSEAALAKALAAAGRKNGDVVIATKWWPVLRTAGSIVSTIEERLRRLGGFSIDLHQVHQPFSFSTVEAEMRAMTRLVEAGKIRAVGVSNFSASRMRRAHAELARKNIPLASNQVLYSLLDRRIERNGVMEAAKELGVTIIAYSPLAQGLLTGKFHDDPSLIAKRPGPRKWLRSFRAKGLARSLPVVEALREIAAAHEATPSEVALAWLLQFHGDMVVAIPGASRVGHAERNVGAIQLQLSREELTRLDELTRGYL